MLSSTVLFDSSCKRVCRCATHVDGNGQAVVQQATVTDHHTTCAASSSSCVFCAVLPSCCCPFCRCSSSSSLPSFCRGGRGTVADESRCSRTSCYHRLGAEHQITCKHSTIHRLPPPTTSCQLCQLCTMRLDIIGNNRSKIGLQCLKDGSAFTDKQQKGSSYQ